MAEATDREWRQRRIERCESWIAQAEEYKDNEDIAFICWWIAFNALYRHEEKISESRSDRSFRVEFFETICERDQEQQQIYGAVWNKFSGPIRTLMSNQYAHKWFWEYRNGEISHQKYNIEKEKDDNQFRKDFEKRNTANMLKWLFDRLYVLRNQIMHGNATRNSRRNRDSMRDGLNILSFLVPIFFGIIKNNPEIDLGKPYYYADDV